MNNWNDIINQAVRRGAFTDGDRQQAAHWGSCAVGEIFNIPPGTELTEIVEVMTNREIVEKGEEFMVYVSSNNIGKAREIYKQLKEIKNAQRRT